MTDFIDEICVLCGKITVEVPFNAASTSVVADCGRGGFMVCFWGVFISNEGLKVVFFMRTTLFFVLKTCSNGLFGVMFTRHPWTMGESVCNIALDVGNIWYGGFKLCDVVVRLVERNRKSTAFYQISYGDEFVDISDCML